ncbi:MAG: hypothetical protein ACLFU8_10890 [Anaerolineales bacterium]
MHFAITEEIHNRVGWEMRSPVVHIEIGLLVGFVLCIALIILLPNFQPFGWFVVALLVLGIPGAGLYLALTTPLWDRGFMERLPDGGVVRREQRWIFGGERAALDFPLEVVAGFDVETALFEGTGGTLRSLARLRLLLRDDAVGGRPDAVPLTDWLEVEAIESLARSVAWAARRPFNPEAP